MTVPSASSNLFVSTCPGPVPAVLWSMRVNGLETEAPASIPELLEKLNLKPATVAVLVNGEVLKRQDWPGYQVRPTDEIELVKFVGGG